MQENSAQSSGELDLGKALVISDLLEWHDHAIAVIDSAAEITLDGSRLEQIDGVGLQLIVAVVKEVSSRELQLTWKGASETLLNGAAELGLTQVLGLDVLIANG